MSAVLEPTRDVIDGAVYIPLALIAPSKTNPRKHFDPKTLAELAASVEKHGVLQPILVRRIDGAKPGQPFYEIVAGERRWRASSIAKLPAIPALRRTMTDFEVLELQVIENLQRDDLHPLEEAEGYEALMRKPDGIQGFANADELAARIGKSRAYVYGRLKLCALIEPAKKAFVEGKINASTALLVARMPATVQADATKKIVEGWGGEPMAYRAARDYLEQHFMLKLGAAPFKITDETLVSTAGSCKACGKRTGANPDLFDDIKSGDVCTDPPCFAKKKDAHQARLIAVAKEEGREVISGAAAKKLMRSEYSDEINGYIRLDSHDYQLSQTKTIGTLLGKQAPPTVLFEHPRSKVLIEVVSRSAAVKILKDKGIVKAKALKSPADAKRDTVRKADRALRLAVAEKAIAAALDGKFDAVAKLRDWLMVEAATGLWSIVNDNELVEKLLGWTHINDGFGRGPGMSKVAERLQGLTGAQVDQALVALVIADDIEPYGKPETLMRVAGKLGIDVVKVKAELDAAAKAELAAAKPKTKTAKKKPLVAKKAKAASRSAAKPVAEAAPSVLKTGAHITPAAAWPFPKGAPA